MVDSGGITKNSTRVLSNDTSIVIWPSLYDI